MYLRLESIVPTNSALGDYVQASLCNASIDAKFERLEQVTITEIPNDSIPELKEHSLTIHYWTSSPLVRQAAL